MNRKNGTFKEYYPDGTLKAEGNFMNNKKNGTWKFFTKDGSKDSDKSGYYMMDRLNKRMSIE
jgi:antitoxin component YwqK of YwqJK toxin-antitoxin module